MFVEFPITDPILLHNLSKVQEKKKKHEAEWILCEATVIDACCSQ
jgi:hypothetical protein